MESGSLRDAMNKPKMTSGLLTDDLINLVVSHPCRVVWRGFYICSETCPMGERISMINRKVTIQGEKFDLVLSMCRQECCRLVEKLYLTNRQERGDEIDRTVALSDIMCEIRDVASLHTYMSSEFEMVKQENPDLPINNNPFLDYDMRI